MEFANKTQLGFDPLPPATAIDSSGTPVYTTPTAHRVQLADLARLTFQRGRLRYTIRLNQSTSAGAGTIKLTDGSNTIVSDSVDFTSAQQIAGDLEADLANVNGGARLRLELDVGSAADGGTTAEVAAALEVEHPVVVTAGCG